MSNTGNILSIILLLAANGFFVAAEFAMVKARGFRIENHAMGGGSAAALTIRIQANLESYLAACQLGITMASLGLGWVGEPAVAAILEPMFRKFGMSESVLHTSSFIVGFLIFSALHIVVGEQVPKTLAIRKAEPVSIWVAYPLYFTYLMVWPLNWLLSQATSAILSMLKVAEVSHVEVFSGEEIKGLVATSKEHGEIHERQATMLHNLFEFDHRRVGRIMMPIHSIQVLDVSVSTEQNLQTIRDTNHSRFPLIDGDNEDALLGIVLAKDIHRAVLNGKKDPCTDLHKLCREPLVVPESQHIARLFDYMRLRRAHIACVVDEYGRFIGIITLEDLLEEIVGEIEDETDDEFPDYGISKIDGKTWEANGLASLTDVERYIGLVIGDEVEANTLGGLFLQRLSRMPEEGDIITESGFQLQVLAHDGRRVLNVRIEKIGSEPEGNEDED